MDEINELCSQIEHYYTDYNGDMGFDLEDKINEYIKTNSGMQFVLDSGNVLFDMSEDKKKITTMRFPSATKNNDEFMFCEMDCILGDLTTNYLIFNNIGQFKNAIIQFFEYICVHNYDDDYGYPPTPLYEDDNDTDTDNDSGPLPYPDTPLYPETPPYEERKRDTDLINKVYALCKITHLINSIDKYTGDDSPENVVEYLKSFELGFEGIGIEVYFANFKVIEFDTRFDNKIIKKLKKELRFIRYDDNGKIAKKGKITFGTIVCEEEF